MDDRLRALEAECAELRRQLAAAKPASSPDASVFLESLLGAVPAFIIRTDADLRMIYVNRVLPPWTMEETLGREVFEFMLPDTVGDARACIANVLATGNPGGYETIAMVPGVGPLHYETRVTRLADPSGRDGVCLVAVDVTRLHTRDLELRRSEERLRVAVEATGIGLWSWVPATKEVHWYPQTHAVYGRKTPVDLGDYIDVLAHPDDRELLRAHIAASIAGGPFTGPIHRITREDGEVRWIMTRGYTELDANGHPARVIGGSLDVTQQHELESQLRHAQRLDAVGHLSAGVAHNFNNMLTAMIGTLEVLARRRSGDDLALINGALESALRSAEMVGQLMTFSGQRVPLDRRPHAIGPVIDQVVAMCTNTFDRHIALECAIATDLPSVRCTPNEIEQVMMNLLVNARDAVADSGRPSQRISVTVEASHAPEGVSITITDDGVGMSEDIARRAFDPFFTTKPFGRGTGLGLTTSYAIVRELQGTMTCTSSPGVGTTLVVYLPGTAGVVVETSVVERSRSARGRVLLVDDDSSVRQAISALLVSEGFDVDAVATGDAGVAHLGSRVAVDVIILDRSMPGAPGESFVPRLRALAPSVPILMFTGQAVDPAVAALVDRVVLKPVSGEALVEALDAVVRARREAS